MPHPTLTIPTDRTCEVCGAALTAANKSGVCSRTIQCRTERHKRWRDKDPELWRELHRRHERTRYHKRRPELVRQRIREATRWTIGLHPIPCDDERKAVDDE